MLNPLLNIWIQKKNLNQRKNNKKSQRRMTLLSINTYNSYCKDKNSGAEEWEKQDYGLFGLPLLMHSFKCKLAWANEL